MKIAVYAKPLSESKIYNGVINYTYNILKTLSQIDKENEYYLYSNKPIIQKIYSPNFHERIINIPRFWVYLGFPGEFKKEKFDIYFATKEVLPLNINRPKSLIFCHDLTIVSKEKVSLGGRIYNWLSIHQVLKSATKILTNSEATKKEICEKTGILPDKIVVTPLGYDRNLFKPIKDKELIEVIKKKYNIRGKYIINTCSTILHRKNILGSIRGFSIFLKRNSTDIKLVFTGKKADQKDYLEVIETIEKHNLRNTMIFTGFVEAEDMPILLSGAEALLFPSFYEGFGLPIIEAMACGCPVITGNVGAMPEVAGNAAIIVDPFSDNEIAKGIEKIIENEENKKALIERGFKRAKLYNWEDTAMKTLRAMGSL